MEDIGGPLLDTQGVVIAVNTEIPRDEKGLTGAVPIGALRRLLSEAVERAAALDPPPAEPIPAVRQMRSLRPHLSPPHSFGDPLPFP